MAETQKKPNKMLAVVTYGIAVLCLVLGLLLPFGPVDAEGYNAVIMQLPHALGCLGVNWDAGAALTYTYPLHLWGMETAFDIGGLFILLYALVTVVSLGMLAAVLLGNKEKETSIQCAMTVEAIGTVILAVLLCMQMANISALGYELVHWSISLLVAFGGPLVMLFIQSIAHKGSSGAVKTVLSVLSLLAVVFCLFSFSAIIPPLAEALSSLTKGNVQIIDWLKDEMPLGSIWYQLGIPFAENYGDYLGKLGGIDAAVSVFMCVLGLLMIVNLILDICGLAKKTSFWMLLSNLIRYGLELLLIILIVILGGAVGHHAVGVVYYLLLALSVIATVINVIRFILFKPAKAEDESEEKAEGAAEEAEDAPEKKSAAAPAPAPVAASDANAQEAYDEQQPTAYEATEPVEEGYEQHPEYNAYDEQHPEAEQPAYADRQPSPYATQAAPVASQNGSVYSPVIYNGPHDEFIDSLNNEQKVEFAKTFLERRSGNLTGIPEYAVDGDNDKFFQSLFIYYARVRGLVSDGLMNRFYEQVSAIKKNY